MRIEPAAVRFRRWLCSCQNYVVITKSPDDIMLNEINSDLEIKVAYKHCQKSFVHQNLWINALFHSSQNPTRKLAVRTFIQSQYLKALDACLRGGFCDEWKRGLIYCADSHLNYIMVRNETINKQVQECKKICEIAVGQHLSWESNTNSKYKHIMTDVCVIRKLEEYVNRNTCFCF